MVPDLEFTGERIVPGKTAEALFREHEERYVFAGQYVAGKEVLDVACGTGVGTSFLRGAGARRVWGLDIDSEAIAFAKARYGECEFAQNDATDLRLPDSSVDVVVSFSTPNLEISRWGRDNPFHVREFHPMEFKELVESVFSRVELFGQRNRACLTYVPKKIILRGLERLRLRGTVEKILARKSDSGSFRAGFINDVSRLRESVQAYHPSILSQPSFLIAVARSTSSDGA